MTAFIFLATLLVLIAIGMPIAFALQLSGVAVMLQLGQFDSQIVVQNAIGGADNFVLMAVPFFILAGEFMNAGGLSRRIVEMAGAFVGHLRGGLGYVAIFAAILLASLSGSAVADTAALAAILVPMMRQAGYDPVRSCGLMAAGGIIAPVIPPSIGFLIFGVVANLSITRLFLAGILPGVMMGGSLVFGAGMFVAIASNIWRALRAPQGPELTKDLGDRILDKMPEVASERRDEGRR